VARKKADNPDEEVMDGFPQDGDEFKEAPDPAAPSEAEGDVVPESPSAKKLRLGDREFDLDPNTAGAFEVLTGMIQGGFDEIRKGIAKPEPKPEATDDPLANIDELLFTEPRKALDLYGQAIEKRLEDKYQAAQQKNSQADQIKEFWKDFWDSNDDLSRKEDQILAEAVFAKNYDDLSKITSQARLAEQLADLTRQEILSISRRAKSKPVRVESGGTREPVKQSKPEEQESNVRSIADAVKERRRKRREAQTRTA